MKKAEECRNRIIEETIQLIQSSKGNIEEITIRAIAERAGVGVGLVNYHFKSKEQLIELCVQQIISKVIAAFRPDVDRELQPVEHLRTVSRLVMDFLMENPSVSRISILGDYRNPGPADNTMKTILGFSGSLAGSRIPEERKKILLFSFVSALQAAFLRKDIGKACYGIDFNRKEERDRYIDLIINQFFKEEII